MRIDLLRAQSEEKVLFSEWLTHYCVGHPHTISPLTVARRGGDDALMNRTAWTEQNRTYTHTQTLTACWGPQTELYPKVGTCTQYYWQRCHQCTNWILVMTSALALILFHLSTLLTSIHCYKCIVERQVNPGMDSYVIMASSMIKTKLSRQVKTTLFNHNESVI